MVSEQVTAMIPHLKVGGSYLFEHVRKGPFVGVYKGTKPAKPGDPQDTIFLEVDAYTEDGSGSERLANAFVRDEYGRKMRPEYSTKYIRPSLLATITSPSGKVQNEMRDRYAAITRKGEEMAAAAGLKEPLTPTLSVPTEKALKRIGVPQETKAKMNPFIVLLPMGVLLVGGLVAYLVGR